MDRALETNDLVSASFAVGSGTSVFIKPNWERFFFKVTLKDFFCIKNKPVILTRSVQ